MRCASSLPVVLVALLGVLCANGCEDAKVYSPTGTPVTDGGSACTGDGGCTASNVKCGQLTCYGGEQYCAVTVAGCGDASATAKSYACPSLPITCGEGSGCSCLGTLAAGCSCIEQGGTPVVTCCAPDGGVSDASAEASGDGASD
jgi:hypothetical protein